MKLGIIGGTAMEELALENRTSAVVDTPWGAPSGPVACGSLGRNRVFFINRHGPGHRIPPHRVNYRANLSALHGLGVEGVIAINAVGGINDAMPAGSLVLPDQIVDYTWGREHTYSDSIDDELLHVDFTSPYDAGLRNRLSDAAQASGLSLHEGGTHAVTQGPRLESAAEVLRLERDGCDIVGMSGMPEAALARELGIAFACVALVVNPAAGKSGAEITMADIEKVMAASAPALITLVEAFCH